MNRNLETIINIGKSRLCKVMEDGTEIGRIAVPLFIKGRPDILDEVIANVERIIDWFFTDGTSIIRAYDHEGTIQFQRAKRFTSTKEAQ